MRILHMAAIAAAFCTGPAMACRSSEHVSGIIHSSLPDDLPADLIVAEVRLPDSLDTGAARRVGAEAKILRLVQGKLPARTMPIDLSGQTSCDYPFANGREGLLVARLVERDGRRMLSPIWVVQRNGFRMVRGSY
jgi:hypothetical protein